MACSDPSIDVHDIHGIRVEQELLKSLVDGREQILNVDYPDSILVIKLKQRDICIDTKIIPYVCLNDKGIWTINGVEVQGASSDSHLDIPLFNISPDGYLILNGKITAFVWETSSLEELKSNTEDIIAIVHAGAFLYLFRQDNKNTALPIVDKDNYLIPDYYFDTVVEKEKAAESIIKSLPAEDSYCYVFFTDAHWGCNQQHSPSIIKHIVDYSPIKDVLFGGDVITNKTETIQEAMDIGLGFQKSFDFLGPRFYCLYGNHDDNSCGQASLFQRHLSEEQVFSFLQSQMTSVHYWDYYNFFYDDSISKTRLLCFDTGRWYESSLRGSLPKTAKFAIEALAEVPNGWHIIAASHIWTSLKNFDSMDSYESPFVRPIIEILENYNKRVKSTFKFGTSSIDYDFSTAGATVEYCIGGHTHADAVVMSQEGIPLITITCDGQQEVAGRAPFQTGTINEQCVTIIANNYLKKDVHIFHIGRGGDISFKMWQY